MNKNLILLIAILSSITILLLLSNIFTVSNKKTYNKSNSDTSDIYSDNETDEDFDKLSEMELENPVNSRHQYMEYTPSSFNLDVKPLNPVSDIDYNTTGILSRMIPAEFKSDNTINTPPPNPRIEKYIPSMDGLIPQTDIQNFVYQLDFPENTTGELPIFNGDNVEDIYPVDNITSLYDTINADVYKGYKQLDFL